MCPGRCGEKIEGCRFIKIKETSEERQENLEESSSIREERVCLFVLHVSLLMLAKLLKEPHNRNYTENINKRDFLPGQQ